ncbi:MAG: site-2 protease family protein [Anaerolineae bacterium]|nr:site-2 protease family protein [Anaerolineae bacterium]
MTSGTFTLGRFFGIPVRLHVSWLLVLVLVTTSLAGGYFPEHYPRWSPLVHWTLGLAASLLFFASVLLHELAHSVVARARGLPVHDIVLFIFGGVSQIAEEPESPGTELLMAIVGPLSSIALSIVLGILWLLTHRLSQPLGGLFLYLGGVNLSLGLFNLLPGFPLDGGRVLRALLWWQSKNMEWATRWASRVGQVIAYGFILLGVWRALTGSLASGLWIAFIGWFLDNAAQSSYRQTAVRMLLAGHTVAQVMTRGCEGIPPDTTLQEVVDRYILSYGRRCLPVIDGGRLLGLVTVHNVQRFPAAEWSMRTAREAMVPREALRSTTPGRPLVAALQEMAQDGVNQLPVLEGEQMVGLLTRENITTFLQLKAGVR